MILTTKARYAVMAIIDMALVNKEQPITLSEISARQNIALSYLEQIFNKLRKADIVKAVKGPGGGYILSSKDFQIFQIIAAVEENIEMTRCRNLESNGCMPNKAKCSTHNLWEGLNQQIHNYFKSITIKDLVSSEKILNNNSKILV